MRAGRAHVATSANLYSRAASYQTQVEVLYSLPPASFALWSPHYLSNLGAHVQYHIVTRCWAQWDGSHSLTQAYHGHPYFREGGRSHPALSCVAAAGPALWPTLGEVSLLEVGV